MNENTPFLNQTSLHLKIEEMVAEGYSYMEAIIEFCEENDLEFEEIGKLMTNKLKGKLRQSAIEEGFLKQESTLPI